MADEEQNELLNMQFKTYLQLFFRFELYYSVILYRLG
jgi:hypothetical protein